MKRNELKLIEKCKRGDSFAQEWMYKKYSGMMLGVCFRYINNRMDAEDIMHESFITIFSKIDQLKNNELFEIWAKRIVVNKALSFLKNQVHFNTFEYDIEEDAVINSDPKSIKEQILNLEIATDKMLSLINELPLGFRSVFNLYVFEKYKHHEIAAILQISVGTSKSQLQRARQLLQKKLFELVKEKNKYKKEETMVLSAIIFSMNTELEYIDNIAQKNLEGLSINPSIYPSFGTLAEIPEKAISGLTVQSKIFVFLSKNIYLFWSSIAGIPIALVILVVGLHQTEVEIPDNKPIEKNNPMVTEPKEEKIFTDSTVTENKSNNELPVKTPVLLNHESKIEVDTVLIKKTIKVKKKVILKQSINISDTIYKKTN